MCAMALFKSVFETVLLRCHASINQLRCAYLKDLPQGQQLPVTWAVV